MPLLFSYGSLQDERVQLETFGRRLAGTSDALLGCAASSVQIDDPATVATLGRTHHANVVFNGHENSQVSGMVFEITGEELTRVDAYEAAFSYTRVLGRLASGQQAWVFVHDARE